MLYAIDNLVKQRAQGAGYSLHIRRLRLRRGDRVAITGPSGCGKSTTLDILGLILRPDAADAFVFSPEEPPTDVMLHWARSLLDGMALLRLRHIGYVLQTGGLLPFLSVADNMALTARMNGMDEAETAASVRELAERLGIAHLLAAMPSTLSVGERQRAAIVRALAPRPQIILADEPTAALDPLHADRVMEMFLRAVEEQEGTLVMVTHNADFAGRGGLRELRFIMERDGENGVRAVLDDGLSTTPRTDREAVCVV